MASDGGKGPAGMSGGSLSGMPRSKPGDRGWPLGEGVKNRNSDSEEEDGVDHKTRDRRKRDREYSIQMRMVDECADGWRRVVGENKRLKEEVSLLRERVRVLEG